jgi:L-threonylcarbamoyladenylate synthase
MAVVILPALGPHPPPVTISRAAEALASGEVIALPTDTVYGLAALARLPYATQRIFAIKRRPADVVLPVILGAADDSSALAEVSPAARTLMDHFWPGALTLVLPRRPGLEMALGGDDRTIGLRCPNDAVARVLAAAVGPLAVTSANRHGEPTPQTGREVAALLGSEVALVLDGGPCANEPSTVVDLTGAEPALLRAGAIPWSDITRLSP